MPWQNIIDIILIFSGNTSECFVFSCHQSLSLSPAWLRCWARSRGRCPGHTARRSRRAAWTAWPRHGPASPGQAGSPPTRRTLALSSLDTGEIMSLKYTRLARPGIFILHIAFQSQCHVKVMRKTLGTWAHFWTWTWGENYAKHLKVQRDDSREKFHIFAKTRSRKGLFVYFCKTFFMVNIKFFPLKVLS